METEKLTPQIVKMIRQAAGLGGIVFDWDVDYQVGAGIVGPNEKCIWTKGGKRTRCTLLQAGGWIISQSKDEDPVYATLERKW